jgi:hypothetical protein
MDGTSYKECVCIELWTMNSNLGQQEGHKDRLGQECKQRES